MSRPWSDTTIETPAVKEERGIAGIWEKVS